MRTFALPVILAVGIGLATPVIAQTDLEDMLDGLTQGLFQQEIDRQAYIAAQDANTARAYRDYLARFPKGKYRINAEQALARLGEAVEGSTAAAAQAEARLGITYTQRVAVQRRLTLLGYNTYGADGSWGRNTRKAIATWQRDTGERVTGYLTGVQLRALVGGVVVTPPGDNPPPDTLTSLQVETALRLTRTQRSEIQRQLTALGYDAGVADGLWGSRTRTAIANWQRANRTTRTGYVTAAEVKLIASQAGSVTPAPNGGSSAALEESLLELTDTERADLQRRLIRLGYVVNRTDGVFSSGTRRAISEWQGDEGETVTGYLTADQVRLIRVETGG